MIKIADLKIIKRLCFDKIAKNSIDSKLMAITIKSIGAELFEVKMSNGKDYARMILDNENKIPIVDLSINWGDFIKVCELFKKKISILSKENYLVFQEGKTILRCKSFKSRYGEECNWKFDFKNAVSLDTRKLIILDDHLEVQRYAITGDKLISCDGHIGIINKLEDDFGDNILLYFEKFPLGDWLVTKNESLVVSSDRRIAFNHPKATGQYPIGVLKLAEQQLSNSFMCNSKELIEKMQQCSMMFKAMDITFGKNELIIKSIGNGNSEYKTTLPVTFERETDREGFRFSINYFIDFCKCTDEKGNVRIMFDDNPKIQMFKAENDKYTVFGMGLS